MREKAPDEVLKISHSKLVNKINISRDCNFFNFQKYNFNNSNEILK